MDILPVTEADEIDEVAALAGKIWSEYWPAIIGTAQTRYMIREFQSPAAIASQIQQGYRYFTARSAGMAVGYYAIIPEGTRMMISKLYVAAESRGKGVGREMMASIIDKAVNQGSSALWLVVNRKNHLAISIYESMGFIRTSTRVKEIGNGFIMDDYVYELSLEDL